MTVKPTDAPDKGMAAVNGSVNGSVNGEETPTAGSPAWAHGGNYAAAMLHHMATRPRQPALVLPTQWNGEKIQQQVTVSFGELGQRIATIRRGLAAQGFKPGDRIIVLFAVSTDLYAVIIALMASGLVPVFIDTGMSFSRIRHGIRSCGANGVISCRAFLRLRWLLADLRRLPLYSIDSEGLGVNPFSALLSAPGGADPLPVVADSPGGHALITFTSGTTGLPKAADRNHAMLIAQHCAIARAHPVAAGEVYATCFPVFVLYGLASGLTTILPPVNFRRVGQVDGALVVQQLREHRVDYLAVGPAFLHRVVQALGAALDSTGQPDDLSLKALVVGGAPVSTHLCRQTLEVLPPEVAAYVGYGSTEAEPIAHTTMRAILDNAGVEKTLRVAEVESDQRQLAGNLVGLPVDDLAVKVIAGVDAGAGVGDTVTNPGEIPRIPLSDRLCPPGEVGEIILRGEQVLPGYLDRRDNARCKLLDEQGRAWHRIGDLGYCRPDGQLVLVGRQGQALQWDQHTVYPLSIESAVTDLPFVRFAAAIADPSGSATNVLVVEVDDNGSGNDNFPQAWAEQNALLVARVGAILQRQQLSLPTLYRIQSMPVDGRHNSKIDRHALRRQLPQTWYQSLFTRLIQRRHNALIQLFPQNAYGEQG